MSKLGADIRRPRRSVCADSALQAEIARVSRMTVEERITAALTMRERFGWIHAAEKPQPAPEK